MVCKPVCVWKSRVTPFCFPVWRYVFCFLPYVKNLVCRQVFFSVSVLREMLRCFFSYVWGGGIFYLFISCTTPFSIYNFCVQEAEVSMVVFFFLNKRHFWTSSPLNDYKWICSAAEMDPIRHRFPVKGNKLHWYHRHGLVSLSCWFSGTRENQHISRQKEQSQNISTCQVEWRWRFLNIKGKSTWFSPIYSSWNFNSITLIITILTFWHGQVI